MECENCGREIEANEQTSTWQSYVVCPTCRPVLEDTIVMEAATPTSDPLNELAAAASRPRRQPSRNAKPSQGKGFIICPNPNCGYRGEGRKKQKAKVVVRATLILLCVIFIVCWVGTVYETQRHRLALTADLEQMTQIQSDAASGKGGDPLLSTLAIACFLAWLFYSIIWHGKYFICPHCGINAKDA